MKDANGYGSEAIYSVGQVQIRTRYKRRGEQRAFVKVAEPNVWVLRARKVWEDAHGPIPKGMGIHHKDEDTLNDALSNLELVSKATHLARHMPAYREQVTAKLIEARQRLRWSTKSLTKRCGRHPANCNCVLHAS